MLYINKSNFEIKKVKRCLSCKAIIRYQFDITNNNILKKLPVCEGDLDCGRYMGSEIPCLCSQNLQVEKVEKLEAWSEKFTQEEISHFQERKNNMHLSADYELFNDVEDEGE